MARANLNKSENFVTNITAAWKYILKRSRICINWNWHWPYCVEPMVLNMSVLWKHKTNHFMVACYNVYFTQKVFGLKLVIFKDLLNYIQYDVRNHDYWRLFSVLVWKLDNDVLIFQFSILVFSVVQVIMNSHYSKESSRGDKVLLVQGIMPPSL